MKFKCNHCNEITTVADSRVPEGVFKMKCPSCSKIITASREDQIQEPAAGTPPSAQPPIQNQGTPSDVTSIVQAEIARAKGEILQTVGAMFRGEKSIPFGGSQSTEFGNRSDAMLCVREGPILDDLLQTAKTMNYNAKRISSLTEAQKELQSDTAALVVIQDSVTDDPQDAWKLISQVNGWHGRDRRNVFLVLISTNLNTGDSNQAFLSGVNLIINEKDLSRFESLVENGKKQFQQLYYIYHRLVERKVESALKIGD